MYKYFYLETYRLSVVVNMSYFVTAVELSFDVASVTNQNFGIQDLLLPQNTKRISVVGHGILSATFCCYLFHIVSLLG
jgi:hypothetical protein